MIGGEMMNNNSAYNKNKAFYIALCVSLIAVITTTVGVTFATRNRKVEETTFPTSVDWDNNSFTVSDTQANRDAENVPDERTVEESTEDEQTKTEAKTEVPTTSETTEKNVSCVLPMGTQILKDFSNGAMVKSKTMNDWRLHNGVDFSGEFGDEIKAISDGTVTEIYTDNLWGKVVEIQHGNDMSAKYCGFDEINVNEGDIVSKEQILGSLGNIPVESADNVHLHLEITIKGEIVDPITALGRENPTE